MNTLVISNHGNAVKVNPETLEVTDVFYDWASVDKTYLIDEDCDVIIRQRNETDSIKTTAKKGDIIVIFYPREGYKPFAIFQSDDYAHNLMYHRIEEEERRKNRCSKDIGDACVDCDTCEAA